MPFGYIFPLDPDCPEVQRFYETDMSDPVTIAYGVGGDLMEMFERKHRHTCKQCQEYGAANVEVG